MRTAVLDVDSIAYSLAHPNKVLDEQGNPVKVLSPAGNMVFQYVDKTEEELVRSADWIMNDILTKCEATHYIGFLKGKNTTTDRLAINPEYKANRNNREQPRWWNTVANYLIHSTWQIKYAHEAEVDDLVNITRLQLPGSFIVAIDGDLLGLEGTHYNWKTQQWITNDQLEAECKFWSDMICGQKGDNIKGIPGKGEKFVSKILEGINDGWEERPKKVLEAYINHFGEYQGIKEFYKNYMSLKILNEKEGFIVPEPVEFKRKQLSLITEIN